MSNNKRCWINLILLMILLLSQFTLVFAQQTPASLVDYVLPGEQVATIQPPLRYRGKVYQIHVFTTEPTGHTDSALIGYASPATFSDGRITGLLITADGTVIEDEEELREIFILYRSAFYLYEIAASGPLGFTDFYPFDDFRSDLRRITRNPLFAEQFLKSLFDTRQEKTEEALRAILTAQRPPPENIEVFAQEVRERAENEQDLIKIVDQTLEAARFSNSRSVREVAKGIRTTFKSWQPVVEQGQSFVKIEGRRIELFNALDILSLGTKLMWVTDLQQDRAVWLNHYTSIAVGDGKFDVDQLQATAMVLIEVGDSWEQRENIVLDFMEDQGIDLGTRLVTEELSRIWVKRSWEKYGTRIRGHNAAGAVSAVLLGFTAANILYGLDDLHSNFTVAEYSDELRRLFVANRMQLQNEVNTVTDEYYDGDLATKFQATYMLESLAAAQAFRSYADGVDATVQQGLTALFNPINWFKGKEWREAAAGLRSIANDLESEVEDTIGHPDFVDTAVALVNQRLRVVEPIIGDCRINSSDGIDLHSENEETSNIYVVCIDLSDPFIRFETVMANDTNNVNPAPDQRETVTSMVRRQPYNLHNPIVAINADYFGSGHGPEGLTIQNGFRIDGPHSQDEDGNETNRVSQSISRLNQVELGKKAKTDVSNLIMQLTRFYNSTGGGPTLVREGKLIRDACPKEGFSNDDECREVQQTAVGVSEDGRTLIIVVAESKNGDEMGKTLMRYGAYSAIKLDGGSSSQLWYRNDEKLSGNAVANALLVFREGIPRHDAFLITQSEFPIAKPGQLIEYRFELRNIGFLEWDKRLPYGLMHSGGDHLGLLTWQPIPTSISTNSDIAWTLRFVAPATPGTYQSRWQLAYRGGVNGAIEPIGPELGFILTVLPGQRPPNLVDAIRQIIDQAINTAEQTLEEYLTELQAEIEKRIQEEIERQIPPWLRCLLGLGFMSSARTLLSQHKRRSLDDDK